MSCQPIHQPYYLPQILTPEPLPTPQRFQRQCDPGHGPFAPRRRRGTCSAAYCERVGRTYVWLWRSVRRASLNAPRQRENRADPFFLSFSIPLARDNSRFWLLGRRNRSRVVDPWHVGRRPTQRESSLRQVLLSMFTDENVALPFSPGSDLFHRILPLRDPRHHLLVRGRADFDLARGRQRQGSWRTDARHRRDLDDDQDFAETNPTSFSRPGPSRSSNFSCARGPQLTHARTRVVHRLDWLVPDSLFLDHLGRRDLRQIARGRCAWRRTCHRDRRGPRSGDASGDARHAVAFGRLARRLDRRAAPRQE
jgi:hypothetical protein